MSAAHWQRHCPLTGSGLRGPAGSPGGLGAPSVLGSAHPECGEHLDPLGPLRASGSPPATLQGHPGLGQAGSSPGPQSGCPRWQLGTEALHSGSGFPGTRLPPTHSTQLGCLGARPEVTCQLGHSCNLLLVAGTPGVSCPEGHRLLSAPGNPALVKTQKRPNTLCSKHPRAGSALGAERLRVDDMGTPAL